MPKSRNHNRLDEFEIQLTPKQWAIRLADESRRYPNDREFLRALAKGTYREMPYIKPFFALAKQAEAHHPGQTPENIRARHELSQKLRTEYHALKSLINRINDEVKIKTEIGRIQIRALANQLHGLILRDAFALTSEKTVALIKRCKATDHDEEERQLTLKDLANVALAAGSHACLFSAAQEWADDATMFLIEMLARKGAVQTVQDKYFDGHAILNLGLEDSLETTIQAILATVATFNEYVSTKPSDQDLEQGEKSNVRMQPAAASERGICSLRIDVEAIRGRFDVLQDCLASQWVTTARDIGTADGLEETGEREEFVWDRFRERLGVQP